MIQKLKKIKKIEPQTARIANNSEPDINTTQVNHKKMPTITKRFTNPAIKELTIELERQMNEKISKKLKEIQEKKCKPDIEGTMGYPPLKNIEKQEEKDYYYQVFKKHQEEWEKQIRQKRDQNLKEKLDLLEYRKRIEKEAQPEVKKASKSIDYTNVWTLQQHINKINKKEANVEAPEKNDALFLTSLIPLGPLISQNQEN